MLITLPTGCENCPFGSLLSFIHIMYFYFHRIRSRVEQEARDFSKFASCILKGNNFNQNIPPYAFKKIVNTCSQSNITGAAVAEWLSSWLAEQEDRCSIPGLDT